MPKKKESEITFEYRLVSDLIPYARNARTHSDEQVTKLASSIKEFGFIQPVVIESDGGIMAGHGRVLAAKKLGLKKVPCVIADYLTDAQKKAYILADNRLALDAGWDDEILTIEIKELMECDFDTSIIGFDQEELDHLLNIHEKDESYDELMSCINGEREDGEKVDHVKYLVCPKCGHEFKE